MKYVIAAMVAAAMLVAISAPCLLTAMQRSNQKRTMGDIRTIAAAWEARARDEHSYVTGRAGVVSYNNLRHALVPRYLEHLPQFDTWGHPFVFRAGRREYFVRSAGKDGRMDPHITPGETTNFDCDVVYANGTFISYPAGVLTH